MSDIRMLNKMPEIRILPFQKRKTKKRTKIIWKENDWKFLTEKKCLINE